jgi:hypothetical protein
LQWGHDTQMMTRKQPNELKIQRQQNLYIITTQN